VCGEGVVLGYYVVGYEKTEKSKNRNKRKEKWSGIFQEKKSTVTDKNEKIGAINSRDEGVV